jgi:cation transport ATPase
MNLKELLLNEEKRTSIFLGISLIALLMSFFKIKVGQFDPAWIAIILCGIPIIKDAAVGLITRFDIKADLLVAIALIASVIIGEIFAAGVIAFIMTIGAFLEEYTVSKTRAGIERLIDLTPRTARVISNGETKEIDAKDVKIGDLIQVLPGETIPVDGEIHSGETSVDQSIMTGEPIPVDKTRGDDVFSGTVNQLGSIIMKATKLGKDSSLQRMIALVESADAGKAKIVRLADKWATWIVVIALSSAIVTYFITGEIIRSVTILVVFCPCALVLATPTAIMAATGNLTKYGILIKEGNALERLSEVSKIIFDKTGTLTYGKPELTDIIPYNNINNSINGNGVEINESNTEEDSIQIVSSIKITESNTNYNKEDLIQIIASLESKSEHPLGKAIVKYFKSNENGELTEVENFEMIIGRGIRGTVNTKEVLAGTPELLADNHISIPSEWIDSTMSQFIEKGSTIIYTAIDGKFTGAIILDDVLREDAREVISSIKRTDLEPILLTGDNEKPANHMAKQVGINQVYHNSLPETKMEVIDRYQDKGENVAMVGDGINDAPSLRRSFIGIAMGGIGSDIAVDAADIALIGDDIKYIPHLLRLSRKTMKTININIIISLTLNFIAFILAFLGILGPVLGALVHNVGSVLVIIYSSFLLKWK